MVIVQGVVAKGMSGYWPHITCEETELEVLDYLLVLKGYCNLLPMM